MPRLSLIIPTHNRAAMLPITVESARRAGSGVDIIVVDDASTDNTPDVCRQLDDVRVIRLERNSGTSAARNAGIRASRAEFIAFLDDDDLRLPDSFEAQVRLLRNRPEIAFVYAQAFIADPRFSLPTGGIVPEELPSGDIFWTLLERNFVPAPTVVARRQCLLDVGLFNEQLSTMEDYDLWIRLAERYPVAALAKPVAVYRARAPSSGQKTSDRGIHDRPRKPIIADLLRTPRAVRAPASQRRRARRRHMDLAYTSLIHDAADAVVKGDARAARSYLGAAVRLNPLHIKAHASLLWLLGRNLVHKLS